MASAKPAAAPSTDRAALPTSNRALVMVALMSATMIQVMDMTIANVALPHMQASLGASQDSISWVLTSYIVALAIATPITGWLADRVGARRLIMGAVIGFVAASMLCGIASNLSQMVFFRLLQGVAGAFIGPLAQTYMLDINRPSEHPRAMSIFSTGMMVGPVCGPIVGGLLTEHLDWRWVFYVNVPVGALCLALLLPLLPAKPLVRRPFDGWGFAFLAIAIGSFQLALDRGEHLEWLQSPEILLEFGLAIAFLWMFVIHLKTTSLPLLDPRLIGNRNLLAGSFFMGLMGIVMMSALSLLPSLLQSLYGYDVVDTGLILSSRSLGAVATMSAGSWMVSRFDLRLLVLTGLSITAFSLWQMAGWSLETDATPLILSGFTQGLGIGIVFLPVNVMSFATLPPALRTDGTALFNLSRNLGSSIGVAIAISQLSRNMQISHADLAQHITPTAIGIDPLAVQALGSVGDAALAMINGEVSRQAAMIAYLDDFKLMMFACLLTLPLILLLRPPPRGKKIEPAQIME